MSKSQLTNELMRAYAAHEAKLAQQGPHGYAKQVRRQDKEAELRYSPSLEMAKLVRAYGTGGENALDAALDQMFAKQKKFGLGQPKRDASGMPATKSWSELLETDAKH